MAIKKLFTYQLGMVRLVILSFDRSLTFGDQASYFVLGVTALASGRTIHYDLCLLDSIL